MDTSTISHEIDKITMKMLDRQVKKLFIKYLNEEEDLSSTEKIKLQNSILSFQNERRRLREEMEINNNGGIFK